ncbi:putative transcription factor C2H2 family [Helianthus debilis subsp. tardiflorus]
MSDEGDKTCPLCAEEMDLTDQQLRPCKCGYDICVWCWHNIMGMAEKDGTEGRCPACRTPYNKEKIVETSSKCERLVAEMSVEKKQKSQKGKTKSSEARKQLSRVRVIQRNLVYIVGLPLNLADEDLLQGKDYFGQYGKVLKVSISRTAAGTIQHFANNTCSVYITYSKEDEAVRSIQSVHGFVLEGRPLRACFGTTKYCHAWLRSMPCTNPDCLYLHEFGSQEDSFTKDETISEYTRCRVQQITGATNEMQRRSGNILPPATDDYSNNNTSSLGKPIDKSTTNDPPNSMKGSPPNSSSGRSLALPAAASWGTQSSNSHSFTANVVSSNGPSKQRVDTCTTPLFSKVVTSSSQGDETLKKHIEERPTAGTKAKLNHPTDKNESIGMVPDTQSSDPARVSDEERIHQLSSDISSISIDTNHGLQSCGDRILTEPLASNKADNPTMDDSNVDEVESDLVSFNNQRLRDPEVVTHTHTGYVHNNHSLPFRNTFNTTAVSNGDHKSALDLGENSIISNILSMDFDPWDESLTSPQNLAKLLSNGDKQGSQRVSDSRKSHNCNQSRFSFAREDDGCIDQGLSDCQNGFNLRCDFVGNTEVYQGQLSNGNGFSSFSYEKSDRTAASYSALSSNKISVSRSQISAPPGFMGPSRAPPPGFTSNENLSGNHMFDSSSLLRKVNQAPAAVYNNGGIGELEFTDPAILAVGGRVPLSGLTSQGLDMRSNVSCLENDNRLRLLVQRSFTQQNQRTDPYGVSTRIVDHNNRSAYQQVANFQQARMHNNGHWGDSWNEVQNGNDIAMAEVLRNERLRGLNKYYSGYEDTKLRVLSSGNVYNRAFGV